MINVNLTEEMVAELINGITERKLKLMTSRVKCQMQGDHEGAKMCREALKLGEDAVSAMVNAALGKN